MKREDFNPEMGLCGRINACTSLEDAQRIEQDLLKVVEKEDGIGMVLNFHRIQWQKLLGYADSLSKDMQFHLQIVPTTV